MTKNSLLFIVISLIIYFAEGVWMVYMGNVHTDESWWFYGSTMVADGYLPHFDFISHHNPLFYYIYAIPQFIFGKSIIVGRFTSLCISCVTFFMTMKLAYDRGGRAALFLCSILFITNIYCIWFYSIVHYQSLQTLLLVMLIYVLFSSISKNVKAFLITVVATLIIGVRYPVDYCAMLYLLFIVYNIATFRRDKAVSLICISTAAVGAIVLFGPHIIFAPDKFFFNTVTYMIRMESWKTSLGAGDYTLMETVIVRLGWLKTIATIFMPALVILLAVALKKLADILHFKKIHGRWNLRTDPRFVAIALFILMTEVFYIIPHSSGFAQSIFVFPLMVFLAAVGFQRVLSKSEYRLKNQNIVLVVSIIFFSMFLQIPVGEQNVFAHSYGRSDIKNVIDISSKIRTLVPKDGRIITFTPIYAGQAHRKVLGGLEMEMASFFPSWDTRVARRYHLMNIDMLEQNIKSREAAAIVLTEHRFFEDLCFSKIITPYRDDILSLIHEHYYLAEKIDVPHSVYRGDVAIFLPRSSTGTSTGHPPGN